MDLFKCPLLAAYNVNSPSFGVIREDKGYISFYACRETFRRRFVFSNREGFLMSLLPGDVDAKTQRIITRSESLQDSMGLTKSKRFRILATEKPGVIYIQLPKFWRMVHRVDFLTAFLRAAKSRYKSLSEVLRKGKYLGTTKPAVDRFVRGNYCLSPYQRSKFDGWYKLFRNKTKEQVETLLK